MSEIREISAMETYAVRHPVLRNGKAPESSHFEGDDWHTTTHFGYFENAVLLGVISLFESNNSTFSQKHQFQIRGMAVLPEQQKRGIGEKLMRYTEDYLSKYNSAFLWFNARESAVGFYKKLGYYILGNPFDIGDIGTHYIMCKKLV